MMDPLSHALTGAAIKQMGFRRKAALGVLLLSSLAPDFDYVTRFWGMDTFLRYHRGITHGVLALVVVPLVIAFIFGFKKGFVYYFSLSLLGYGTHLCMDLTNQYGTRILAPLDWEQYSLDLSFIVDPYIIIGLLVCVVLGRRFRKKASLIAAVTLLLLVSYFGMRYYLHNRAEDFLRANLDANTYKMCPLPNDFLRWWFVARSGDEFITGFADLFTRRVCVQERYVNNLKDPYVMRSKTDKVVESFLYFAKYPHAEVKSEGGNVVVVWRELAYSFRAGEHFATKVFFDKNGRIVKSEFSF
ncbi:MAG: metal-dependent hydrolase [Nitrospirae bacterium]|nr:metal-dependent hydrolase [Nitrospirota bacterium]